MTFYVVMIPAGTFTTSCFETASNFYADYHNHNPVWQTFNSYEQYIENRFQAIFELIETESN